MPEARRMDGYIRVSRVMGREGDSYISPSVQREAIERWAEYKGVVIAEWHVDEDWSGGTHERPGLEAAVERAVTGETGGIVSWKIDRFSRQTEGGLRDLRRLQDAGADLSFVSEDIDTAGPMGKFVYTLMLAMAELFLDNIKASWSVAKERAHGRGAKIGPTPFGYRRGEAGRLEIHPDRGAHVAEAFRLAAERGVPAACDYLVSLSLVHEGGKRKGRPLNWTTATVRRLLANRTYLGELHWGDLDTHADEALRIVTRAEFESAQHKSRGRRAARHFPLSGLAKCGTCGGPMVGGSGGADNHRTYRCRASLKTYRGEACVAGVNINAEPLEEYVRAEVAAMLRGGAWASTNDSEHDAALADAERALVEAEHELDAFLSDTTGAATLRRLGRYDGALQARADAVEGAQHAYRELASQAATDLVTVAEPELIESATPEELGHLVRGGLAAVVVARGRRSIAERVRIIPKGAEPDARVPGPQDRADSRVEA